MDYDPNGALGGLFAPAYVHGNPQSEAAVNAWRAANPGLTRVQVEQTANPYVDPEALRVSAQGGNYDMNARRNAIAAQVQQQQQPAQQQLPTTVPMAGGGTMPIYGRSGTPDAYLSSPEGQYFTQEMNRIAQQQQTALPMQGGGTMPVYGGGGYYQTTQPAYQPMPSELYGSG